MKSICKVRSRLEGFLGPFFPVTAGILVTSPQRPRRPRRHRTAQDSSASAAAQDSPDSGHTGNSATALATALVTGFSSNSYVFL